MLAGTAAGAREWARLTQPSLHIPPVEAAMATTIEETGGHRRTYLPAAGHDWFLPLYDPFVKLGGFLHLLDFAGRESGTQGLLIRLLHSHARLADNDEYRIRALMKEAGLADVQKVGQRSMLFARLAYYRASAA